MKKVLISALCVVVLVMTTSEERTVGSTEIVPEQEQGWRVEDPFYHIVEMNQANISMEVERVEREKKAEEERLRIEAEQKAKEEAAAKAKADQIAKQKAAKPQTKKAENFDKNQSTRSFKVSFYTALPEENGGYEQLANGQSIHTATNVVASNYYPLGTKIYLEGWGVMTVADRGGPHFNSSDRLDILVPRRNGESKQDYKARAMKLGRQTISGYIVK